MRKSSQMLETAPAVIAEARYQAGLVTIEGYYRPPPQAAQRLFIAPRYADLFR
jgi:hypothetical protein